MATNPNPGFKECLWALIDMLLVITWIVCGTVLMCLDFSEGNILFGIFMTFSVVIVFLCERREIDENFQTIKNYIKNRKG